jgi:hypothetical protein
MEPNMHEEKSKIHQEKPNANKGKIENPHIQEEPKTQKGNPNVHKEEPRTCQG